MKNIQTWENSNDIRHEEWDKNCIEDSRPLLKTRYMYVTHTSYTQRQEGKVLKYHF